jgi:ABC-type transport system involved in multi-copper enzyme maturation permease subunit
LSEHQEKSAQIYDQGYKPWNGQLGSIHTRFLVIAFNQLRLAWREKWFRRLILGSMIPLVVFCVLVVFRNLLPSRASGLVDIWANFWAIQVFFSVLMVYFVGRRAVGEELRTGAMVVYFSRPVNFVQYLFGKWLAIFIGVVSVTFLPGFVLAIFRLLAEPAIDMIDFFRWLAILLGLVILLGLCLGMVMLALSSLTKRGRTAGILWIVLYFIGGAVASGLNQGFDQTAYYAVSFTEASIHLAKGLFGAKYQMIDMGYFILGQL